MSGYGAQGPHGGPAGHSPEIGLTAVTAEPLSANPVYTRELRVARAEVCNWAIRFERLRRKVSIGWLSTVAWLLVGAGGGAWIQNGKWNTGALVCAVAGGVLLIGAMFARQERTENLHNLCDDFLRFVDQWEAMDEYSSNSEYVRSIVNADRRVGFRAIAGSVSRITTRSGGRG